MYQRIVTAVDQVFSGNKVIKTAQLFSQNAGSVVVLLHAVKRMPSLTFYYSLVSPTNVDARYCQSMKSKLDYIAAIQDIRCHIKIDFGSTKAAIKRCCQETKADLVVVKRGRTARALLQSLSCDILVLSK